MRVFSDLILNTRVPVYLQICRGVLRDGDALPSRRELAVLLGINPNTAQKAYKALEEEGIMHTDGNAGSVISVTPEMRAELLETRKEEAVQTFLSNVKALGLSFQQSIALLTEKWEE